MLLRKFLQWEYVSPIDSLNTRYQRTQIYANRSRGLMKIPDRPVSGPNLARVASAIPTNNLQTGEVWT
jgi:hypothetical protein